VGKLISINRDSGREDWRMAVELPEELERYVVPKGSIAIEGISLTVAQTEDNVVHIAIIPHTFESTNLKSLQPGDLVNIEADVLAKYAEKMLRGEAKSSGITVERLISEGF
jgi:riboflavin synthase